MKNSNSPFQFYEDLPILSRFSDFINFDDYKKVPEDWYIIITDIVNSTIAIESGKYKEVNTAGAIATMAIANIRKNLDFPFVFGGDGMTYLIPPEIIETIKSVLVNSKQMINDTFDLDLRVGVMKVSELYTNKQELFLSKYNAGNKYTQALIRGSGLEYAEEQIKRGGDKYLITKTNITEKIKADYSGFSCRWQDIPSSKDETISLIISVKDYARKSELYSRIMNTIFEIGGSIEELRPITEESQKAAFTEDHLSIETRISTGRKSGLFYRIWLFSVKFQTAISSFFIEHKIPMPYKGKNPVTVKRENIVNADYRKYDGTLKMVLSFTTVKRKELNEYLESLFIKGEIFYGIHVSDRALMTCFIHFNSRNEVHFIDAADGGYAYAAKQLKGQIKEELIK